MAPAAEHAYRHHPAIGATLAGRQTRAGPDTRAPGRHPTSPAASASHGDGSSAPPRQDRSSSLCCGRCVLTRRAAAA
jgi:hypothetical protein